MGIVSLKLRPGINVEATETLNESGISACNLIRFRQGLPEKLGGWEKYFSFAVSGIPRDLHPWQDLNDVGRLSVGTTSMLGVITAGAIQDITPQTKTTNPTPNFTTTIGSPIVTVVDAGIANVTVFDSIYFNTPVTVGGLILSGLYPITLISGASSYTITAASNATASVASGGVVPKFDTTSGSSSVLVTFTGHGVAVDDTVVFPIATSVGGISIIGSYRVASVLNANEYRIGVSNQASSTASAFMNAGLSQLVYYISLGPPAAGVGYGIGAYGVGGFGTGVVPDAQTGTAISATDWSTQNWGEILLATPKGGGIYFWNPNGGFTNATLINTGPIFNGGIFVAMPQQILVAWGSTVTKDIGVDQDPLLVRWSDQENFLQWSVTAVTQAGSFRISTGSKIMGGLQGPTQALIWTDLDIYAMRYLGHPLVFGFNKIGTGCGLIGQHAATTMRDNVYWMSPGNFFAMSGNGVRSMPCSVWDVVFQNLDTTNQHKCVAAANSAFNEVAFYYPSLGGTGENDSYVKVNLDDNSWDYGTLNRSAWTDQSVIGEPLGTTATGIVYQHETSPDADGQPLSWFFETGWFVISNGQDQAFVDWFFPDMKWGYFNGAQSATVLVTITAADYTNATERVYGPFTMNAAKTFVNCRLRGRLIKLKFEGNDVGTFARLGLMRYRVANDGRR